MSTVTSGTRNGKVYKISHVIDGPDSYYELLVYDRDSDQYEVVGSNLETLAEAEAYLTSLYGAAI